jgi:hypothetical protein
MSHMTMGQEGYWSKNLVKKPKVGKKNCPNRTKLVKINLS